MHQQFIYTGPGMIVIDKQEFEDLERRVRALEGELKRRCDILQRIVDEQKKKLDELEKLI